MLLTVILVAKFVMAQSSYEKRDASQIQSRIIATAAGHLQNMDLEDPAFLSILEVIASKINETEQCAYEQLPQLPSYPVPTSGNQVQICRSGRQYC